MYDTLHTAAGYLVGIWTVFLILFWTFAGFRQCVVRWSMVASDRAALRPVIVVKVHRRLP